jgi:hypothetical protein
MATLRERLGQGRSDTQIARDVCYGRVLANLLFTVQNEGFDFSAKHGGPVAHRCASAVVNTALNLLRTLDGIAASSSLTMLRSSIFSEVAILQGAILKRNVAKQIAQFRALDRHREVLAGMGFRS